MGPWLNHLPLCPYKFSRTVRAVLSTGIGLLLTTPSSFAQNVTRFAGGGLGQSQSETFPLPLEIFR